MTELKEAIKNLSSALEAHMEVQKQEGVAREHLRKTRYAVTMASEQLRMVKQQILDDNVRDL